VGDKVKFNIYGNKVLYNRSNLNPIEEEIPERARESSGPGRRGIGTESGKKL
jgi:hypothetical protein